MKLTMKNDYSFQKAMGYSFDPAMMGVMEVKQELRRLADALEELIDEHDSNWRKYDELTSIQGILRSIADGGIEYTEPFETYEYVYAFEYGNKLEFTAPSQVLADEMATDLFLNTIAPRMPQSIGESMLNFKWLERLDNSCKRIYESQ